jgi:hypothetical protein
MNEGVIDFHAHAFPDEKDFQQPPKTLQRCEQTDHYREWTQGCKNGKAAICPVKFGCEMTEVALLGALALRTNRTLEWDSNAMRITNNDLANSFVDPPYRTGWSI